MAGDVRTSALFRWNVPDPRRMRGDIVGAKFQMHALARRWMRLGAYTGTPGCGRPNGARSETAAAVRADIMKLGLDAIRTERALVGTDPRFRRVRRQILVAIFAVRSKLQRHGRLIPLSADHRKSDG